MIYYELQHHGSDVDHLPQVDWLDDPEAIMSVSIDTDEPLSVGIRSQLLGSRFQSVLLNYSIPVTWAHISIVDQVRSAMARAIEQPGWIWFVTLSGACAPVRPLDEIKAFLKRGAESGVMAYRNQFKIRAAIPTLDRPSGVEATAEALLGRITIRGPASLISMIKNRQLLPVNRPSHRKVHRYTLAAKNSLRIDWLDSPTLAERDSFFNYHGNVAGRQWVVLHRKVIEWLVTSRFVAELRDMLSEVFIPDEFFFQVALHSPECPFRDRVASGNLWYNAGGSARLSIEDIVAAAAEDNVLFARKCDSNVAEFVSQWIEAK